MQSLAEVLRWTLVFLQGWLVVWMLRTGLWRRLPVWTAWLAMEALSRGMFSPTGHYAHQIWLILQPGLLLLLAATAVEAHYQVDRRFQPTLVCVLGAVPLVGVLPLPDLIQVRLWIAAAAGVWLWSSSGHGVGGTHARIMGSVCGLMAGFGWIPARGASWWAMRAWFLGGSVVLCLIWLAILSRLDNGDSVPPAPAGRCRSQSHPPGGTDPPRWL